MGTWGTRLYEDDTALDARGNFLEYRKNGMAVEDAEKTVIDEAKTTFEGEPEWMDIIWLAICCAELETGTLSPRAKKEALEIIDSGQQYDFWIAYGGSKADAGARSREMTLIKKYIVSYDGKPVKRKSWVALQKANDDYEKSLSKNSINSSNIEHQKEPVKSKPTNNRRIGYVLGGLAFVPLLGFFAGVAAIIVGIKWKQHTPIVLGTIGASIWIIVYGLLFYYGFVAKTGPFAQLKIQLTSQILENDRGKLAIYFQDHGNYPARVTDLSNTPSNPFFPSDPWNKPFEYKVYDNGKKYSLISAGPNGTFGDSDDITVGQ